VSSINNKVREEVIKNACYCVRSIDEVVFLFYSSSKEEEVGRLVLLFSQSSEECVQRWQRQHLCYSIFFFGFSLSLSVKK